VDDAEHQDHPILIQHVIQDAVVTNPQPVERVRYPLDRLGGLAADMSRFGNIGRQLLQGNPEPSSQIRWQLLERLDGGWSELDAVGLQSKSLRFVVLPRA
jgi:hypothetical protein